MMANSVRRNLVDQTAISALIRDVPDFPKQGIVFKDIAPLLSNPEGFQSSVDLLVEKVKVHGAEAIVGIESRGFIFGAAVAARAGLGLELVRKPGKLPFKTRSVSYELEYGQDSVEIHRDAIIKERRYAIVDDVIATGGTAEAAGELVVGGGGVLACYAFLIELDFLEGRKKLGSAPVESIIHY